MCPRQASRYCESNKFDFAGGDWKVTKDLTTQYYYANLDDYYTLSGSVVAAKAALFADSMLLHIS